MYIKIANRIECCVYVCVLCTHRIEQLKYAIHSNIWRLVACGIWRGLDAVGVGSAAFRAAQHFIDGANYVVHFLARDVAVVVHVVQFEGPCECVRLSQSVHVRSAALAASCVQTRARFETI